MTAKEVIESGLKEMFDQLLFDNRVSELIKSGKHREAEDQLLKAHAQLKAANAPRDLEHVAGRLAQFYSMPQTEDRVKAEDYFSECESMSSTAYTRLQTATFYFYVLKDFSKTIKKVEDIKALKDVSASPSYYSALTLKGQALINLGMIDEAGKVLNELLSMIRGNPAKFPFGDEINFLEAAVSYEALMPTSHEILSLIIPKIRSQEYVDRAKALLKSI
jgi:tetratricopeptide (TPR) repeat protein